MSLAQIIGVLGAGMGGYARGRQMYQEEQERKADRAYRDEQRRRLREQQQRDDTERDAVAAAVKPLPVTFDPGQASMDQMGPPTPSYTVGDRRFADVGMARKFAADPQAAAERVALAQMSVGDYAGAQSTRLSAKQERVADQQLADATFERQLRGSLSTPDTFAAFASQSHADGEGGNAKFKAVVAPDGSWHLGKIGGDGTLTQFTPQFPPGEEGMAQAGYMASRAVTPAQRMEHFIALKKEAREAAKDKSEADYRARQLAVAQRIAATNEAYRRDQINARMTGGGAVAPPTLPQVSLKDRREFLSDAAGLLPKPDQALDPQAAAAAVQALARADAIFTTNAERGSVLTAAQAVQAMRLAADPKNVKVLQRSDGMAYEVVAVNGAPVIVSQPMRPKPQQPAQPAAQPSATRASVPAAAPQAHAAAAPLEQLAPQVLQARLLQEKTEMGEGKRLRYSPEVQAYVQAARAKEQQAEQAASAAARQAEFERAKRGGL